MADAVDSIVTAVPANRCLVCGSPAARPRRSTREYCSDECYRARKKELRNRRSSPTCSSCGEAFIRRSNRQKFCDDCRTLRTRKYTAAYNSLNAEALKIKRRQDMRLLRERDPAGVRERQNEWRARNREKVNARRRTPEYRAKKAAALREKCKADPRHRVHNRMASAIYQAIKAKKAGRKWELIVGYTLDDLMRHIERQFVDGMSWQNMGSWHIDHIVPKSVFSYSSEADEGFRAAWALTNLRPLWSGENQRKHASRLFLL